LFSFLSDVEQNTFLLQKITDNPAILDAWKFLIGRAQIRADESILEATSRLLQNNTEFVNNNVGKAQNIFDKLAATVARCRTSLPSESPIRLHFL